MTGGGSTAWPCSWLAALDELYALVPQSSQAAWDLVVRRWPRIVDAAVRAR